MSEHNKNDGLQKQNACEKNRTEALNEELRREVAEYDMLMESTGVCIVKVRMGEGFPVEWCNEATYRAIGYTKSEYEALFGYDVHSYFRGRETSLNELNKALETALSSGRRRFQAFIKLPRREGSFWAQCSGTFTDFDRNTGKPACVYGVFTDVTGVVETKERLAEADRQNAWLEDILNHVPAGISVCTIESGRPVSITINRHLAQHLGIPGGTFPLERLEQITAYVHAEDQEHCRNALLEFLKTGKDMNLVCRLRRGGMDSFSWVHIEACMTNQTECSATAYVTYTNISALKETEKTLQEAVVSANLLVWEYDIASHTIYLADNEVTAEYCRRFGFGRVITHVPQALAEYVTEDSMPVLTEMFRQVENGENASCEIWYKRIVGMEPHCERISCTVERDERGKAIRAYAVGVNITAEKNAEERYSLEQSYLRENKEFNLIAKGHYNLTQNKVLEYSLQKESNAGADYFFTEAKGTYDEEIASFLKMPFPEEDRVMLAQMMDRQTLLRRHHEGHLWNRAKYRRLIKGGLPLWISIEIRTYQMPDTGDIECFSYTYDITDKVRSEEIASRIAETKFDYVGLIFAESGMFEFLQKSPKIKFPELHVHTPYAVCCDYVRSNFVSEEERQQFDMAMALENIIENLEKFQRWSSIYHRTENGKTYCKQVDYSWLDRQERIILAVRTDISASYERDQKQLSQMREAKMEADRANDAKSAFLSGMSHDMRTPLNAVLGFTDLALKEADVAKKQEYLKKVQSSGGLLLDLVSDTLELSRIESGKMILTPEAICGSALWESVFTSLRPEANQKNIRLIEEKTPELDEVLWVDRIKLQKVLLNLISNAIKYTPPGGTVRAYVETIDPPSVYTRRITVEDNGIGIGPEFLPKVFEPFAQEHRPEAGKVMGTGLGLAIVRRIVDLMGGVIRVESKVGCGSRFTVELPLVTLKNNEKISRQAAEPTADLSGKTALLCEDNDLNAEIVTILLKEKGMNIERAVNGKEGAEKFADSPPGYFNVILMDIRMPVMDGYRATEKIRGLSRPDAKSIPILAMTADAFESDIQKTREVGMNGYMTKPIDPQKLCRMLAEQL